MSDFLKNSTLPQYLGLGTDPDFTALMEVHSL